VDADGDGASDVLEVADGRATLRGRRSTLTVTGLSATPRAAALADVTGDGAAELVVTGGGVIGIVVLGADRPSGPAGSRTVELEEIGGSVPGWRVAPRVIGGPGGPTRLPGDEAEVRPVWDLDGDGVNDIAVYTAIERTAGGWAFASGRPCASRPAGSRSSLPAPRRSEGTVGRSPVLDADAPDPTIVYDAGWYHLYTTNALGPKGWARVPHQRSRDLQHWEPVGDAMPVLAPWASSTGGYVWAPGVHRFGPRWVLYYTARGRADAGWAANRMCVGRAMASTPDGPFVDDSSLPLVCQFFEGGTIDADVHVDGAGAAWLLFKNDGNCCGLPVSLWAWRLHHDGLTMAGWLTPILPADQRWEAGIVEAPSMVDIDGHRVLLYSGGAYATADYAIGWAECAGPAGPCTKHSRAEPWLGPRAEAVGPGGQDGFRDASGGTWLAYHGWRGATSYADGGYRALFVDRLRWGLFGPWLDESTPYTAAAPSAPGPPTGLGGRAGYGYVSLWWEPPANPQSVPVHHYMIVLRDAAGGLQHYVVDPAARAFTVPFLSAGTYVASILTASDLGYSTASAEVVLTVGTDGSRYSPVPPSRLLDTRDGTGRAGDPTPIGPGETIVVPVAGRGGLPPAGQVAAVTLNLTATWPTETTHLTAWPGDQPAPPETSSINVAPGETAAKHVTVAAGADGTVRLRNNSGRVHALVDLTGFYGPTGGTSGSLHRSVVPTRLLDTRDGTGQPGPGPVGAGRSIVVDVAGRAGLPPPGQVRAAVVNLTVTGTTATTHVRAWPGGTGPVPLASVLNAEAGQTVANLVTVGVGADGRISLYNQSGSAHVVADLVGWFGPDGDGTGAVFHPLTPARVVDSRIGFGFDGALAAGQPRTLPLNGRGGLPLFPAADSVVATVTAVAPTLDTHVTVYPRGPRPATSTLNVPAGSVRANEASVSTDSGFVSFDTNAGATDVVVDLMGWYRRVG
jgi:hypothetical protein